MSLCSLCKTWAARTPAQFLNRQRNLAAAPDVDVAPCPQCGSTDWANAFIAEEVAMLDRHALRWCDSKWTWIGGAVVIAVVALAVILYL